MTFSSRVKNELARVTRERICCQRAELAALIAFDSVERDTTAQTVAITTENASSARKLFKLLKKFSPAWKLDVQRQTRLRKSNVYKIMALPWQDLFAKRNLGPMGERSSPGKALRRAYLQGAFLALVQPLIRTGIPFGIGFADRRVCR